MRPFPLVALALVASGCATLVRGPTESVTVGADQDSAFVFVDGVAAGVAPVQLDMKRARSHRVEVAREGYRVARDSVERRLNPAVAVVSVLTGGVGIDASSGAVYDLRPTSLWVSLAPDSAGVDADYVSSLVRRGRDAARDGVAWVEPVRARRASPWVTAQVAVGSYVGGVPGSDRDTSTGGLGVTLLVGARDPMVSARLSATTSAGFLFDNSERWEIAALVGATAEAAGGRLRLGLSAGPGLAGGRTSDSCFLCTFPRERTTLPTRFGLSVLGEAYVFPSPRIGVGVQVPANLRAGDTLSGVMIGGKFEGL